MGEGLAFIDIILFAMIAGFILLRLRSVLGRRTGNEQRRPNPYNPPDGAAPQDDNVVSLPDRSQGRETPRSQPLGDGSPLSAVLTQIGIADPAFDREQFLAGAHAAYEMVVTAFARGDRETLQALTSDDVFRSFELAIEDRESRGEMQETTITAMRSVDIVDAAMSGSEAEVTVKFVSTTVSALKDAAGDPVGGPPHEQEVTDIWTFARDLKSNDPNWLLIATGSEN